MMSKRAPKPGLLPIPHFASKATLCIQSFLPTSGPVLASLAFFSRSLHVVSDSFWGFPAQPAVGGLLRFGADFVAVPQGAEFWGIAVVDNPADDIPRDRICRVRWELAL